MRWQLVVLLAASFACTISATAAGAAAVTISPAVGSQRQAFTISGDGLQPGVALDINFKSPAGEAFSTAAVNKVIVVGSAGSFGFAFVPADEFQGESFGTWLAQVCISGTDDCVQTTFEITP